MDRSPGQTGKHAIFKMNGVDIAYASNVQYQICNFDLKSFAGREVINIKFFPEESVEFFEIEKPVVDQKQLCDFWKKYED